MVICFYGKMAIVRTAWTDKNPGRCFWGCPTEVHKGFFGFQHKSPITRYNLLLDPNVDLLGGLMVQCVHDNQQIEVTKHKTQMLPVMQLDSVCVCSGL
uniref:Zinc finger GRF-type domain-containing protein n=1 Tax=Lactuca sativa TaxID=4236 RepID=A0A9R1XKP1_LACSA|nr:hypothetical protein LSAT_V11C300143460 [Lactuca sativa]